MLCYSPGFLPEPMAKVEIIFETTKGSAQKLNFHPKIEAKHIVHKK